MVLNKKMTTDKNTLLATILNVHNNVDPKNTQLKDNCIIVYNLVFLGSLMISSGRLSALRQALSHDADSSILRKVSPHTLPPV